jgi:glycine/D-amino acid oxidase-like deaminating enzyme
VSLDGPEDAPFVRQAAARIGTLFAHLAPLQWEASWSGWIAMTSDQFARVHQLAPGVFAGLGYSGRGIAASTLIGRELAERACGTSDKNLALPLSPLQPIFAHRFAPLAIRALVGLYRALDRIEDAHAGRRR